MAERVFERIFAQASAAVESQYERIDPEIQKERAKKNDEAKMRSLTTTMTVADAIKRILLAETDRDYFRMLELPAPEVDALGRPKWEVTPTEVSKAYRKLSILVHPDKNPGEEARKAFEALNQAHRLLKDPGQLEGILKEQLDRAQARKEEIEARASLEERVVIKAQQKEEAKVLRKAEGEALQAEVVRQMREKQERAKRRREAEEGSKYKRRQQGEESGFSDDDSNEETKNKDKGCSGKEGSESDDEGAQRRRLALAKRRQRQKKMATNL